MDNPSAGPIPRFGDLVDALAGRGVRDRVMAGSESITDGTSEVELARWVQGAIARLDEQAPQEIAVQIMETCGRDCASMNHVHIEKARAERLRYDSEEEYLEAELGKPEPGTRLERRGDALHLFYTPRSYNPSLRCYCSLVQGLPEAETMSRTYCHCSVAFVKALWEEVLGRPVIVELVTSAVSGSGECEFRIKAQEPNVIR